MAAHRVRVGFVGADAPSANG